MMYALIAQLVFLGAGACAAGLSLAYLAGRPASLEPLLAREAKLAAEAVIGIQAALTLAALAGGLAGVVPLSIGSKVYANWVLVALAGAILPTGLIMEAKAWQGRARPTRRQWWMAVGFASAGLLVFSLAYYGFAGLLIDLEEDRFIAEDSRLAVFWVLFPPVALMAAPLEEVIFRLGIQRYLERLLAGWRRGGWWAIAITAAIWAVGHSAYVRPHGVKELQIFVLGVVLGWMRVRYGIGAAIAAHLALNAASMALELVARAVQGLF